MARKRASEEKTHERQKTFRLENVIQQLQFFFRVGFVLLVLFFNFFFCFLATRSYFCVFHLILYVYIRSSECIFFFTALFLSSPFALNVCAPTVVRIINIWSYLCECVCAFSPPFSSSTGMCFSITNSVTKLKLKKSLAHTQPVQFTSIAAQHTIGT